MVGVNSDNDRDKKSDIVLGALIEFLRESHDVDTVLSECRADRGRRSCFTGRNLQLDVGNYFLSHGCLSFLATVTPL